MARRDARRGPCHAHDSCECGRPICTDCPDLPERCADHRLNLAPTTKALVDGISPYLLGDDSDGRIVEERWVSEVTRRGCIEVALTFEEVA